MRDHCEEVIFVYYDPFFLQHDTGQHPESTVKLLPAAAILAKLDRHHFEFAKWNPATAEQLQRVHTANYLTYLEEFCATGGGQLDEDTVASKDSFAVALSAAGAACDAVLRVCQKQPSHPNRSNRPNRSGDFQDPQKLSETASQSLPRKLSNRAFCLIRPPGHHALSDRAMGFCLLNNIAIAARVAIAEAGLRSVLIVDWDVHHGNGTEAIFYHAADVAFFSMHRRDFYPYTGSATDQGAGPGEGYNFNLPIKFGTPPAEQMQRFESEIRRFADHCQPELILISAGFDAHRLDPLGSLGLEVDDFIRMTEIVKQIADQHCQGRIVSLLEGGYHPDILAESVRAHVFCLADWPES